LALLLALAPHHALAHSGPPAAIYLPLAPTGAFLVVAALWLKNQTKFPALAAVLVVAVLLVALASTAFFLPGLLPVGNQNYAAASLAVNLALTVAVVIAAVLLLRAR
jgi:hypothetical protein